MGIDYPNAIQRLERFARAVNLGAALFDPAGKRLFFTDSAPGCGLCQAVCATVTGLERCAEYHSQAGMNAWQNGGAALSRCHAGAAALVVPLVDGERYCGSAALLPLWLRAWEEDPAGALQAQASELGLPAAALGKAARSLPVIDGNRMAALSSLLAATPIAESEDPGLRAALALQRRQLGALIDAQEQALTGDGSPRPHDYPIHLEREMLGRVRLGDKNGARAMLNELLAHIFMRSPGNLELIKARLLELVVMISRAAVESGAGLENLLGLNYNFISAAAGIDDYEELSAWIVKVLDTFLEAVYASRGLSGSRHLTDALSYIRSHHMQNLALEDVAAQVYVSPYYLSHLFKEKLGVTFVEYLTRVRVENAKSYLLNTKLPIAAIAEKVGYEDASYFGKVFRRLTGTTPNAFRRGS